MTKSYSIYRDLGLEDADLLEDLASLSMAASTVVNSKPNTIGDFAADAGRALGIDAAVVYDFLLGRGLRKWTVADAENVLLFAAVWRQ